jgi:hypothetical protein
VKCIIRTFFPVIILAMLVSACNPASAPEARPDHLHDWKSVDLRWLNPAVEAISDPDALVAFYFRSSGSDLEFRLDLLDLQNPLAFDLYLALDTQPGGSSQLPFGAISDLGWDILLVFPANGQPAAILPDGGTSNRLLPRIIRDPFLDSLLVQANLTGLPGDVNTLHAQAFLTKPGAAIAFSQTPPVAFSSPVPTPARLLLTFWNVLPAATPVQALRHWDGAHTGPSGQRHGLAVLLRASQRWKIPIFLLDLKSAPSLAALELLGALPWIQTLELSRLVELPQYASGDPLSAPRGLLRSLSVSNQYQLLDSAMAFGPFQAPLPADPRTFFAVLPDPTRTLDWNGQRLVPLPRPVFQASTPQQIALDGSQNGLSIELKKTLLQAANSNDPARLVVIGADLSSSALGDFSGAGPVMEYLATHPWVEVLDQPGLDSMPAKSIQTWPIPGCSDLLCSPLGSTILPYNTSGKPFSSGLTASTIRQMAHTEIQGVGPSPFQELAWESYFSLTRPSIHDNLAILQANLIGQIGYLTAAARWSADPQQRVDCQVDLDWDGLPECILATNQLFSIIKPDLGCLVLLAGRIAPAIMPTSLVSYGLSDPSSWLPQLGLQADPGVIPGAFCFKFPGNPLKWSLSNQGLLLEESILYSIDQQTLTVQFLNRLPGETKIPFLLALPGENYLTTAASFQTPSLDGQAWNTAAGRVRVSIRPVPTSIKIDCAFDSQTLLNEPEIPDRSYPPGHFIPFPFAVATIQIDSQTTFTLQLADPVPMPSLLFRDGYSK